LSEDNVLDSGDELVGEKEVGNLKNGKFRMTMVQFELEDAEPGQAYLIVKVDGDNDVSETNENNNTQPEKIKVKE
jgi:subtilase family serine protease